TKLQWQTTMGGGAAHEPRGGHLSRRPHAVVNPSTTPGRRPSRQTSPQQSSSCDTNQSRQALASPPVHQNRALRAVQAIGDPSDRVKSHRPFRQTAPASWKLFVEE
ncbi:hypothetical protein JCM5353_005882, partial [Sporobolomyces roseus]